MIHGNYFCYRRQHKSHLLLSGSRGDLTANLTFFYRLLITCVSRNKIDRGTADTHIRHVIMQLMRRPYWMYAINFNRTIS